MRQQILLESADFALLKRGKKLSIQLPDQTSLDIVGPTPNGRQPTGRPVGRPRKAVPTVRTMRGTCPYCKLPNLLLSSHISSKHPGKPVNWDGDGAVECAKCKRRFPPGKSLSLHMGHAHGEKK